MFGRALARSSGVLAKIYTHPFNQQLANGSLSGGLFKLYVEQDSLYLREFATSLTVIANRCSNPIYKQQFTQLSIDMVASELNWHRKHLDSRAGVGFFSPTVILPKKIPIIAAYTQHLHYTTTTAPLEVAIASCIPCFWIYSELGKQMNSRCQQNNPYYNWISSYSSQRFLSSTQAIVQTLEELAPNLQLPLQEQIISSFYKSAEFELRFFDAALMNKPLLFVPNLNNTAVNF